MTATPSTARTAAAGRDRGVDNPEVRAHGRAPSTPGGSAAAVRAVEVKAPVTRRGPGGAIATVAIRTFTCTTDGSAVQITDRDGAVVARGEVLEDGSAWFSEVAIELSSMRGVHLREFFLAVDLALRPPVHHAAKASSKRVRNGLTWRGGR